VAKPRDRIFFFGRVLTDSPLARMHERLLERGLAKKLLPIPWEAFTRKEWAAPALDLAADATMQLAVGEYSAVALFSRIAAGLVHVGAPLDLIALASRVPSDEIRHADYALRAAARFSGRDVNVPFNRTFFEKFWERKLEIGDLDLMILEVSAISETIAATLLSACKEGASEPMARAFYATVLADEVHHARLGWYYLAWRAPQWTRAERQRVADRAGEYVVDIERRFWTGRDAPRRHLPAARALGVLESARQRVAIRRVMTEEMVPALDALGLGASLAWKKRRRGRGAKKK
jgi:hypothetical protein